LTVGLQMAGPADQVDCVFYTPALVRVGAYKLGAANAGWNRLNLPLGWRQGLAPGLYYAQLRAWRGPVGSVPRTVKVLLLP
jgi:hypothetical protein